LDRAAAGVLAARPAELLRGVVREALPEVELAPRPEVAPTPRLLADDAEIEGLLCRARVLDLSVGDGAAALQFATSAEAEAFASAAGDPTPAASLEALDLNRPEVQRYVAELLVDPGFEKFVGDLGEYYDRLKKTLPADATDAMPFVRGRGGTASKRTDPMDDD